MIYGRTFCLLLLGLSVLGACAAPASPPASTGSTGPQGAAPQAAPATPRESRTLVVAIRVEPATVAIRPLTQSGVGLYLPKRTFNGEVAYLDDKAAPRPYLVEALPQLNTDSWKVFPDGRMETTYRIRPNIQWHDGTAFTADDFVFGWRVYSTPGLGHANLAPYSSIDEVLAPDPRTLVIKWKRLFPDVAFVSGTNVEFPSLPRHILEPVFQPDQLDAFAAQPFWTREYVGTGPYKMDRWEPGAFLEAVAYDAHIGGRAKIDRVKMQFMPDNRASLAGVLSGDVHMTDGTSVGLPEVAVLKRQWISQGKGGVLLHPNQWRAAHFQFRPDYIANRALLNPTVRKALAYSVDREPLNEALYDGDGIMSDNMVPPQSIWGPAAERGSVKYPHDPQRAEQLMRDAGYTRGAEGFYTHPTEGRLTFEVKTNAAADNEAEVSILASSWRQVGFDAQEAVLPAALAQNAQARATFSSMYTNSQNCCESAALGLVAAAIPNENNRWAGGNRSGWSHPEFERLSTSFTQTLAQSEREQLFTQMMRVLTDDVQSITLFIRAQPWVYVTELKGLTVAPPEGNMSWDMPNWEFK
jgi:peptide/nickel transport system substrate-binding protein